MGYLVIGLEGALSHKNSQNSLVLPRDERRGILPAVWVLDWSCPPKSLAGTVHVVHRLQNDLDIHLDYHVKY